MTHRPQAREPVLQQLLAAREDLLVEVLATIQATVPAYTRFESTREEHAWTRTVAWLVDLFLQLGAEARWLTQSEADTIRDIGRTRRTQSFSLEVIATAVEAAVAVVKSRIDGYGSSPPDRTERQRLDELADRFGKAVADLLREGFELGSEHSSEDHPAALLQDVVDHRINEADELVRRAQRLGCSTVERAALICADSSAASHIADSLARVHSAARTAGRFRHTVMVIPVPEAGWSATLEYVRELVCEAGTTLLVIEPSTDLEELYDRYSCAAALVPYLGQLGGPGDILFDHDFELVMVMAALPRDFRNAFVRLFLRRPLDSCDTDKRGQWLDYLDTNIRLGFSAAAIKHGTGRNRKTVYDWREKCEEVFRRSLTEPRDQAVLTLARYGDVLDVRRH